MSYVIEILPMFILHKHIYGCWRSGNGRSQGINRQPIDLVLLEHSGGRLNKKDGLTGYGDSHVKDKTS